MVPSRTKKKLFALCAAQLEGICVQVDCTGAQDCHTKLRVCFRLDSFCLLRFPKITFYLYGLGNCKRYTSLWVVMDLALLLIVRNIALDSVMT